MVIVGVFLYIARKRYNFLVKYLRLKYLLEFHIFLCVLGPILILFHTAFKFGGIVSAVSYTHLRAHETPEHLVCRLLLVKKNIFFFFFFQALNCIINTTHTIPHLLYLHSLHFHIKAS